MIPEGRRDTATGCILYRGETMGDRNDSGKADRWKDAQLRGPSYPEERSIVRNDIHRVVPCYVLPR